jgi:hypothetical protein
VRKKFNDRLGLSEAVGFAHKLLAQWPRPPTDEPYMLALATALKAYPRCIATGAIEPVTGVGHDKTFGLGPTVADVISWCDREVAWMIRVIDADNVAKTQVAERAKMIAAEPDRSQRPTLEELKRKYGANWGLAKENPICTASPAVAKNNRRINDKIIAEYERMGQKPIYAAPDILISPMLAKQLLHNGDRRSDKPQ